jgi:pSer/pThr/pTyr-binding forkhead associated (FHA) protein
MGDTVARLREETIQGTRSGDELEVMSGPEDGRRFALDQPAVTIGRLPSCDISLPLDPSVSRNHARLTHDNNAWVVDDLGSRYGTEVDGAAVRPRTPLRDGAMLRVGETYLRFRHFQTLPDGRGSD